MNLKHLPSMEVSMSKKTKKQKIKDAIVILVAKIKAKKAKNK